MKMLSALITKGIKIFAIGGSWKGSVSQETDIFSLTVYLTSFVCGIIVFVWVTQKFIDEGTLETFEEKFLKFEKRERERLLKKYIKSKNDDEQTTAKHVFFEYFNDISKETKEEIVKYLSNNIKTIKKPGQKEIEIRYLLEILDKYFDDLSPSVRNDVLLQMIETKYSGVAEIINKYFNNISPSVRNNMLLKMIEVKDFSIAKVIKNHLKEIPAEILNKAFVELSADEEMMEILYDYDKSTCIDEGMKEEALRRYVETKWIDADVEILRKFLERGIYDKKLREDVMTILSLKENRRF